MIRSCGLAAALAALAACEVEVARDLPQAQADNALAALKRQGIQATKSATHRKGQTRYALQVDRARAVQAWQVLQRQRTRAPAAPKLGPAPARVLLPGPQQQRARLRRDQAQAVARTLEAVPGVALARVHLSLPAPAPLAPAGAPRPRARASVLLKVRGKGPAPMSVAQVRAIVSGAVQGLAAADVAVVTVRVKPTSPAAAPASVVQVGPFSVAPHSRSALLGSCIAALLVLMGLGLALLNVVRQNRRLRRTQADRAEQAAQQHRQVSRQLESSLDLLDHSFSGQQTRPLRVERRPHGESTRQLK